MTIQIIKEPISKFLTCAPAKLAKAVQRFVRPLPNPARVRIGYECPVEKRIQYAIDGMVH